MNPLYLIAEIHPNPEKLSEAKLAFDELIAGTKSEPGCLLYDLVIEDKSDTWIMLEKWESVEAWNLHIETGHVKKMQRISPAFTSQDTLLRFLKPVQV